MSLSDVKMAKDKPNKGAWIDEIHDAVGRYINIETTEGIVRNGRLTGVRSNTIRMGGKRREIIHTLELNGDPTDTIEIARLVRLDIG